MFMVTDFTTISIMLFFTIIGIAVFILRSKPNRALFSLTVTALSAILSVGCLLPAAPGGIAEASTAGSAVTGTSESLTAAADDLTYEVVPGDTLWSISRRFGTTVTKLKQLNGLTSNTIYVGQVLKVKAASAYITYKVVQGDTLWSIAKRYGTTVEQLKLQNKLSSDTIYVGQVLKIHFETYKVVKGDTLWSISRRFGTTVAQLKQLNGLSSNTIYIGQILKVRPQSQYTTYKVIKGDTLWSIAKRFGTTVDRLKQLNGLSSNTIYEGQILKVEDTVPAGPSKMIYQGSTASRQIALTFDAGADIAGIRILDVLKKHNVKATFFLTGKWVEKYPDYARRIVADGHEIANHTYSHPDCTETGTSKIIQDIRRADQAIIAVTGQRPSPYFRFPFGAYNNEALDAVGAAGYPYSIQWSLDTIDWKQPSADVIVSRIKNGASNGDIVLMHIGGINTPQAVDQAIPALKGRGFKLVTVSQVLGL